MWHFVELYSFPILLVILVAFVWRKEIFGGNNG